MSTVATVLIAVPLLLALYAYGIYPLALLVASAGRRRDRRLSEPDEWPSISVVLVAHNAEYTIRSTIERLLAIDYPADRRQILIVSDASTDKTDRIVSEFACQGVELHRMEPRAGKTAAENAIAPRISGEIVVNADASVLLHPGSVKALVRNLSDPSIGVASGRAVSIPAAADAPATGGDAAYYSYEMWLRSLESNLGAVIGATGALYAVRRSLFAVPLAPQTTRDFASPLIAHERGFRTVIDGSAICYVRQTPSLRREYHRKVRTMVRGLDTLYEFRRLMDPMSHGAFAVMLLSHKLCRWLVYLLVPLSAVGVLALAVDWWPARVVTAVSAIVAGLGVVALRRPTERRIPAPLALCGYALVGGAAGATAWLRFLSGRHAVVWEPTRRVGIVGAEART